MNLAIEYLLRDKRVHGILTLPTSLFMSNEKNEKLVVTLNNSYGQYGIMVKHWKIDETTKEDRLPPFVEHQVSQDDLFTSPHTVLEDYTLIDYEEEPYQAGNKQHTDYPHGVTQEREYHDCLQNFYNSQSHQRNRHNWLWESFERIYIPDKLKFQCEQTNTNRIQIQHQIIQFYSKPLWYTWQYWRKRLLDFPGAAAELVFSRDYVKKQEPPRETRENYTWTWDGATATTGATSTSSTYFSVPTFVGSTTVNVYYNV